MLDDIEFSVSRPRTALMLLAGLAFVGVGIFLIGGTEDPMSVIVGWVSVIFFGFVSSRLVLDLLLGGVHIRIGAQGFEYVRFGVGRIPWSEVEEVRVLSFRGTKFIALGLHNEKQWIARMSLPRRLKTKLDPLVGEPPFMVNHRGTNVSLERLLREIQRHMETSAV